MPTLAKGIILELQVPDDFESGRELPAGMRLGWYISCGSRHNKDVQIGLYFRGAPIKSERVSGFRRMLQACAESVVFDHLQDSEDERIALQIAELQRVLGNAGNNQICNKFVGAAGPRFFLEKLETIRLNSKPALTVQGYFHDYHGEVSNHYLGVFVDASPDDGEYCRVEELVYQAPCQELFEKYLPRFQGALSSIRWGQDHPGHHRLAF